MAQTLPISAVRAKAYTVPTAAPESDGTLEWNATTLVLVRVRAGDREGIGYSYTTPAAATLINNTLGPLLLDRDALSIRQRWYDLWGAVRNIGRQGLCATAISALDVALWDLYGRFLEQPVATLLGRMRDAVDVYGSGGFTSYDNAQLRDQVHGWREQQLRHIKIKVGRNPAEDPARLATVREAAGDDIELMVDANGAFSRKQALAQTELYRQFNVTWLEEPVSSDDIDGLRLLRDRAPAPIAIAAGEYGYDVFHFQRLLSHQAVDVLQADATRCGGITGFMQAAALCEAWNLPLSAHCAPALHLHACCAAAPLVHIEYFHDHVRIEQRLFDTGQQLRDGRLLPDLSRPGLGLEFRSQDAEAYA